MSLDEEAAYVLDDVFLDLSTGQMNVILDLFFNKFGVDNDWDTNENQMNKYLVKKQDELEEILDLYLRN
jgi:hypothetical protein